jgi:hypothetical protein
MAILKLQPPQPDEVEVSLFGPSYGECVLIHVGCGDWMIVDSCVDQRTKEQPALRYLEELGVDSPAAVKLIVATHWHDDHIQGMSRLVAECVSAQFCCSLALRNNEFLVLVGKVGAHQSLRSPGVREFFHILERLKVRAIGSPIVPPITWSLSDKLLWRRVEANRCPQATVTALSPSDASVTMALNHIGDLIPRTGTRRKPIAARRPNHTAVVIQVEVGEQSILLGADLEETGHPRTGWEVIVDSTTRPQVPSSVFKVPHHGSKNADQPRVWSEMLTKQPVAVLAPFRRGQKLPTEEDRKRICGYTPQAFWTASTKELKPVAHNRVAEKIIRDTVKSIHELEGQVGHIRLRRLADDKNGGWSIELVKPAESLCKALSRR